jgi:hypothetical protein
MLPLLGASAQTIEPNLKWGKPTEQELMMTEYEADKDADAVMLYHKTDVFYNYINGDFKVIYKVNGRLKVLKPEGKRVADRKVFYYENEISRMTKEAVCDLKATAYNLENGKLVKTKLERSMINDERLDKNEKVIKFSVPQVKVGTVIEYEYRIESDLYYDIRTWNAQSDIPVLYATYELTIPEWFKFNIEETGVNTLEKNTKSGVLTLFFNGDSEQIVTNEYSFTAHNLPAIKDDDFLWCASDYGCKVTAELAGIYIPGAVHKNYATAWSDIDKQLMEDEDFGGRLKKSSPLKDEIVAAGIPAIADKKERFAAVWKLLKSKVRWNGDYAFWGKSASKVLKEGTGSNADINFLLINMLQDAGVEAVPVLMRTRNNGTLPLSHASLKYLTTFVIGVQLDNNTMNFFDSSAEDGYLNVLPSKLLVNRARILKKGAEGDWVNLQAVANSREVSSIVATLNADGVLTGQVDNLLSDEAAAGLRRTWREAKDSVEQINKMQERDHFEMKTYQVEGRHDFSSSLKEHYTFSKQCDAAGDIIYLNPLVIQPIRKSPFDAAERTLPIEFPYKQSETMNVVITLPEGYEVEETPKPLVLKCDGITARVVSMVDGNTISTQYKMNLDKSFFLATDYQHLKEFFDYLAERCKSMITIKKK